MLAETKHKKDLGEFFSNRVSLWEAIYRKNSADINLFYRHFMRKRKAMIYRLIRKHSRRNVSAILDAGCGAGGVLVGLDRFGHKVVGTDISLEMLKEARVLAERHGGGHPIFVQADIEHLPFREGSFDTIVCAGVLEYLPSDEKGVVELSRVTRKGGLILASLPNMIRIGYLFDPYYYAVRSLEYIRFKFNRWRSREVATKVSDFGTNEGFTNKRYFFMRAKALFGRHGLRDIDAATVGYGPLTFWRNLLINEKVSVRISDILDYISRKKLFRCLIVIANRWVFCLRKEGS